MFGDLAIGDAKNIDRNHGLRSPSDIAAVNADVIAVRHHETRLVLEVGRQVAQQSLDRRRTVWDQWIMLAIVAAEEAVENGRISIDKNALDPCKDKRLVRFSRTRCRHAMMLRSRWRLVSASLAA